MSPTWKKVPWRHDYYSSVHLKRHILLFIHIKICWYDYTYHIFSDTGCSTSQNRTSGHHSGRKDLIKNPLTLQAMLMTTNSALEHWHCGTILFRKFDLGQKLLFALQPTIQKLTSFTFFPRTLSILSFSISHWHYN